MEVPFKELDKNPLETFQKIYDAFEFLSSEAEGKNEKNKKEKYKEAHGKAKAYIDPPRCKISRRTLSRLI